ncbi:MAG: sodium:calcium antiporter [Planctomycetales bacterium]
MEEFIKSQQWPVLLLILVGSLAVLGKAADWLVKEAVALSERSGMPKFIIGATIVSLGTTTPEVAVSVLAALGGHPDLALGNAVGSIICDTGLILGVACLIAPLQLPPSIVNRQGWVQLGSGFLLVALCWPWSDPLSAFTTGGTLAQWQGFVLVGLLGVYLWLSARWARAEGKTNAMLEDLEVDVRAPIPLVIVKLLAAVALVVGASHILIPAAHTLAVRAFVPEAVIAATLVAFGTSLPEFVTAVTAARHGHGDLAVGNIVGADILNVLFVAGLSAAATPAGLKADERFFVILFPTMLFVLIVFRVGIFMSGDRLKRPFGLVLLASYVLVTAISFAIR